MPSRKRHVCVIKSLMRNMETVRLELKQCAVLLLPCQSREQTRAVPQTGAGDAGGGAGLYVSNERWQETLPAPTHVFLLLPLHTHTRTHAHRLDISNRFTGAERSFYFSVNHSLSHVLRTQSQPPRRSITSQYCLAQKQDQCIIQMTVRAFYKSLMWISSSWLEGSSCRYFIRVPSSRAL